MRRRCAVARATSTPSISPTSVRSAFTRPGPYQFSSSRMPSSSTAAVRSGLRAILPLLARLLAASRRRGFGLVAKILSHTCSRSSAPRPPRLAQPRRVHPVQPICIESSTASRITSLVSVRPTISTTMPDQRPQRQAGGHHVDLRHRLADEAQRQVDDQHRHQHRGGQLHRQRRGRLEQPDQQVEQRPGPRPATAAAAASKLARTPRASRGGRGPAGRSTSVSMKYRSPTSEPCCAELRVEGLAQVQAHLLADDLAGPLHGDEDEAERPCPSPGRRPSPRRCRRPVPRSSAAVGRGGLHGRGHAQRQHQREQQLAPAGGCASLPNSGAKSIMPASRKKTSTKVGTNWSSCSSDMLTSLGLQVRQLPRLRPTATVRSRTSPRRTPSAAGRSTASAGSPPRPSPRSWGRT